MKLIALLSWFDESPEWLEATIDSLPGVDHLVALDGAYQLYPGGGPESPREQHTAISDACHRNDIAPFIVVPGCKWQGNECEKRSRLFAEGNLIAEPGDWFMVIDADEVCQEPPADLRERLEATELDVAEVLFHEPRGRREHYPIRILFRAQPIQVVGNHYTYLTADGRKLWGPGRRSLEPALDLTDFEILHRTFERDALRSEAQHLYYKIRGKVGVEIGVCIRCGVKATRTIACGWERNPYGLIADYLDVCDTHAIEIEGENAKALKAHGLDPVTGRVDPRLVAIQ